MPPRGTEVYVEFVVQGAFVKATAIDSKTGIEASVIGPAAATRADIARIPASRLRGLSTSSGTFNALKARIRSLPAAPRQVVAR